MIKKTIENKKDVERLKKEAENLHKETNASVDFVVGTSDTATTTSGGASTATTITQYGWVCPKCGRVNAPWKGTCDCSKGVAAPNIQPNKPFPLAPYYEPYIPHIPYYEPPIKTPNPYDPYDPYKWGDAPGWWNKGPTCEGEKKFVWGIEYPDGHIEKCPSNYFAGLGDPIPCTLTPGDPNFGRSTTISTKIDTQAGGDSNIKAYN